MQKAPHLLLYVIVALLIVGLPTACRRTDNTEGKMIFRYNECAGIGTLDPAFAKDQALIWATSQLFGGLVRLDNDLIPQPHIAKNWEISADGLHYTFHLRNDVQFHRNAAFGTPDSTRRVTAHDFTYSLLRLNDPALASPGMWVLSQVDSNGISAADDSTLLIRLRTPLPYFLSLLAMPYCSVVPREVVERYGADFRKHPCGTGPFQLQLWKENVKLVLRRNPLYFERDSNGARLPRLDAVAITFIADKQTAFLQFVQGKLDFLNSIDASYKDELLTRTGQLREKYAHRIVMQAQDFLNTEYLGFNMADIAAPTADRRIRQAISCGFDRAKMMKYLRNGVGQPGTGGMIPPSLLPSQQGSPDYGYTYDPERAKELLAAAGYPNGAGLPPIHLSTTAGYLDLCRFIQQQLSLIGIEVRIDVNPPAALREQIAQGKTSWFRGSWIADYPDAENYMSLFYSPNSAPTGPNYTRTQIPALDRLYRRALLETDFDQRATTYRQMDSLMMANAPVIILYYDQILHFTHPNVHGLRSNAMNSLDLRYTTIDPRP